jgi:hypothetical protein
MLSIGWSSIDEALADGLEDMIALHWEEVALDKTSIPLDVDWDGYRRREREKTFRGIAMRCDGRLIGYNAFFITPTLHYRSTLHALNDVIYVDPDGRGMAGVRLLRESEHLLSGLAPLVKVIYHTKLHVVLGQGARSGTVGTLLERLGYSHIENVYAKLVRS